MTTLSRILILLILAAPAAHAASGVSSKFDGIYEATAEMVPWMSTSPACLSLAVGEVSIKGGIVRSSAHDIPGAMRGFITAEGYLDATVVLTPPQTTPLNGRMDAGQLTAGAIDDKSGCAWLVKLTPRPTRPHAE